jgi:hypothetical protein
VPDDLHRHLITHHQLRGIRIGSTIILAAVHLGLALPVLLARFDQQRQPSLPWPPSPWTR